MNGSDPTLSSEAIRSVIAVNHYTDTLCGSEGTITEATCILEQQ
jgi:hypothetical protein